MSFIQSNLALLDENLGSRIKLRLWEKKKLQEKFKFEGDYISEIHLFKKRDEKGNLNIDYNYSKKI